MREIFAICLNQENLPSSLTNHNRVIWPCSLLWRNLEILLVVKVTFFFLGNHDRMWNASLFRVAMWKSPNAWKPMLPDLLAPFFFSNSRRLLWKYTVKFYVFNMYACMVVDGFRYVVKAQKRSGHRTKIDSCPLYSVFSTDLRSLDFAVNDNVRLAINCKEF